MRYGQPSRLQAGKPRTAPGMTPVYGGGVTGEVNRVGGSRVRGFAGSRVRGSGARRSSGLGVDTTWGVDENRTPAGMPTKRVDVHRSSEHAPPRRHEISRLEAFSDAVFAFALTLLVVSLDVPSCTDDLIALMAGFVPFAASFALLTWIWDEHNIFFWKYGLQDAWTTGP